MTSLQIYKQQVRETCVKISLTIDQAAAVIKAHDDGVSNLPANERDLIDQVMSSLKFQIAD